MVTRLEGNRAEPRIRCRFEPSKVVHDVRERGKVMDRDENRAKSQNSTTSGSGQHRRRGGQRPESGTPMMTQIVARPKMGRSVPVAATVVPGLGKHPHESESGRAGKRDFLMVLEVSFDVETGSTRAWGHLSVT